MYRALAHDVAERRNGVVALGRDTHSQLRKEGLIHHNDGFQTLHLKSALVFCTDAVALSLNCPRSGGCIPSLETTTALARAHVPEPWK